MSPSTVTTYGPGGYDPTKPEGNVTAVEIVPENPVSPDPITKLAQQVVQLTDAVDLLILESLGGPDV